MAQKQVEDCAARNGVTNDVATRTLLARQPSGKFVATEQLGALAVFLCSHAAEQVRGVAWAMDGVFTAQ